MVAATALSWSLAATAWADASVVTVSLQPTSIVADGASTTTATATVTDGSGNPVSGETVELSSGGTDLGPMTDQGGGTYTGTVTSTTTAGDRTITATDGSISGQATLTQTAGPVANVALALNPTSIVADGTSTSTATATLTDANGNRVSGETVELFSGATDLGPMTDQGGGTYTGTVTSTTSAGNRTIKAVDGSVSGQATLTQTAGPVANVGLALNPTSIVANGTSTSTATATVTDANGNRVAGDTVTLSSGGTMTDQGGGTYTGTVTSSTTAGNRTITASDGSISGQATLTQTAGPAANVALALNPTSIVANGTSTSTATATVTDANGNPVSGETVTLSSGGTMTDQGGGSYRGTVTSSTTAGNRTITATDGTITGQATLTQTPGPAAHASLLLLPTSIVANGISETTATLTVTDAHGNRVPGESITFTSDDPGELPGQASDNGDGTYTAKIRSSTAVNPQITIKGVDAAAHIAGQAMLAQVNSPSTTALAVSPSSAVSNQAVTLLAAVNGPSGSPHGTVIFESAGVPIAGCSSQAVSQSTGTATCSTSFSASVGTAQLSAIFSPDAQSTVDGSSGSASLTVGRDSTSVMLGLSSLAPKIGATENLVAFVTPAHTGSLSPSGTVTFLDNGSPISRCTNQSLLASGGGGTATCAVSYTASASHKISAIYNGDANFSGAQAAPVSVPVQFLGTVKASVHWSFVSGPGYTSVLALTIKGAPIGSTVLVSCKGKGCPFANRSLRVSKTKRCGPKGKHTCLTHGNLDLTSRFAKRHLRPRTTITVDVVQPGWIGRAYTFVVRSHKAPSSKAVCVTPGTSAPTSC